jgi:hypothetical protein
VKNCLQIQAASTQLSGYQPEHFWINSLMWYNILLNLEVRNAAGIANKPFATYERMPEKSADGMPQAGFMAEIVALPWISWHISDEVIVTNSDVDPTWAMTTELPTSQQGVFVKVCPDNTVMIMPEPSQDWTEVYLGAEYISENAGQPMMLKRGYTFWKEWVTQPSCIELIALMNALPLLYVPKSIMYATVAGF